MRNARLTIAAFFVTFARTVADVHAQRVLRFGGFVDAYYAWDSSQPPDHDRLFTTQPARHNEFNVNLAFIEASVEESRVRGRLALQAGTSVQANYATEPTQGAVSGSSLVRHLQEAFVGVRVAEGWWIDGGIFFSHLGSESWISSDNPTYTRSLGAEFSPYYQAGIRATWSPNTRVRAQLNLVNGWQNVSESNGGKALGARLDLTPTGAVRLSVYNFLGNEAPEGTPSRLRAFQGISARLGGTRGAVTATFDLGWQEGVTGGSGSTWYSGIVIGSWQATPTMSLVARAEAYHDPDQVIVATATTGGFRVLGGSVGIDVQPSDGVLWRSEIRGFTSGDSIYPGQGTPSRQSVLLVSALTLRR